MVKRSIEQEIRNKNFGARIGNFEKNAVVKNQGTKQRVQRILGDCWQWETNGQCVKGNNCSFRHDMDKRGKSSPSNPSQDSFVQQSERKPSRTRSPRGKSPSGRMSRWPCKDYLRGTCNNSFCKRWHPPECLFYKNKNGCRFGEKCSFAHRQVDAQPTKWSKSNNDKSAVALLKRGDWQERGLVTDQCHDRSGKLDKRSDEKLRQNSSKKLWMIVFSAEAILASSTSKFGKEIPRIDDEDLNSSTESTNSTTLIHCIASVGNCEQVHTSVLTLIFQQA